MGRKKEAKGVTWRPLPPSHFEGFLVAIFFGLLAGAEEIGRPDKPSSCQQFPGEKEWMALPPPKIGRHECPPCSTGVERVYTEKK